LPTQYDQGRDWPSILGVVGATIILPYSECGFSPQACPHLNPDVATRAAAQHFKL